MKWVPGKHQQTLRDYQIFRHTLKDIPDGILKKKQINAP